jgi:putative peptidoglycan lipid II flippase
MKKTALILMFITIVSKILGVVREMILSYFYGASSVSDAYLVALSIPGFIFAFVGVGLSVGYLPVYLEVEKNQGSLNADSFTSNLVNVFMILSTFIVIIGFAFADKLVLIFASGFRDDTLKLAVFLTRIMLGSIYFMSVFSLLEGYLHIKNSFIIPSVLGFPKNFFIILGIILSYKYGIGYLAFFSLLGIGAQVIFMIPFVYKKGYRHRFILDFKDENIVKIKNMAIPLVLGVSVGQINLIIDRTIASRIAEGGISALHYANLLNGFITGVVVVSVITSTYPTISRSTIDRDMKLLKDTLLKAINGVNIFLVPAAFGLIAFAEPIVQLVYGRGQFDVSAVGLTYRSLVFYAVGLLSAGIIQVITKVYHAEQETREPTIYGGISLLANILLNIILSKIFGVPGLALATSISGFVFSFLLVRGIRRRIGIIGGRSILRVYLKTGFSSILMVIASRTAFSFLLTMASANIALILSIALAVAVYFLVMLFMGFE